MASGDGKHGNNMMKKIFPPKSPVRKQKNQLKAGKWTVLSAKPGMVRKLAWNAEKGTAPEVDKIKGPIL